MSENNQASRRMSADETAQMAELVAERRAVLAEILAVTQRQQTAIEAGLVEQLLETLNEKQIHVDRLSVLQSSLKPMAEVAPEHRTWVDSAARDRCRAALNDSERLQSAILAIDKRCEEAMLQRRDELFDSIGRTTGAAAAARAYASGGRGAAASRPATTGGSLDLASG